MLKLTFKNGETKMVEEGSTLLDIVPEFASAYNAPIVVGVFNGEACDLQYPLKTDGTVDFIDVNQSEGMRIYVRSLLFLFLVAVKRLYPEVKMEVRNTLGSALYCIDNSEKKLTEEDVRRIEAEMRKLIAAKEKIQLKRICKDDVLREYGCLCSEDRKSLLCEVDGNIEISIYYLCGEPGYFFGPMCPDVGYVPNFELIKYDKGVVINYPDTGNWQVLPPFKDQPRLNEAFHEAEVWSEMIHCNTVGKLNKIIELGYADKIVQVAEALHEKKIAGIADEIALRKDKLKLILIAGPSSSGKTSFAQRLSIQLAVNGIRPMAISMDDYYLNRVDTPRKPDGSYDFECIDAIDLELFNDHLTRLLRGECVKMPKYNFRSGVREYRGKELQMHEGSVLIVEGIHGLNDKLTVSIPAENKMKIYVSALTPMSMDEYNRINTTDMRLLRRIVRDAQFRSHDATATLNLWDNVRYGEEQYIFPFQCSADVIFNTTLIYEFAVLKKYAQPRLEDVTQEAGAAYYSARRLLGLLAHVKEIDDEAIPKNSILREFIGGSAFAAEL